jgi:chromosomal replication initiator protein
LIDGESAIPKAPLLLIREIQGAVAAHFRLPMSCMTSARRSRKEARPRQIAMYLARELTPKSLPQIGRMFGWRDHTTVIHACKQIERLAGIDKEVAEHVSQIREDLGR